MFPLLHLAPIPARPIDPGLCVFNVDLGMISSGPGPPVVSGVPPWNNHPEESRLAVDMPCPPWYWNRVQDMVGAGGRRI